MDDIVSDEEPYFHYSASLRIFGDIVDLDEISTMLGLRPTRFHRRSDRKCSKSFPYEHDMCAYTAPVAEDRPLDVHIATLWSHIRAQRAYLLQLKSRCSVNVFCGYRSSSGSAGIEVSPGSLEMFIELDVPFGLSIIVT